MILVRNIEIDNNYLLSVETKTQSQKWPENKSKN